MIFPLRFGLGRDEEGLVDGVGLDPDGRGEFRERFLDGTKIPPILPPRDPSDESELISDRALVRAITLNLTLRRRNVGQDEIHLARLAALSEELADVQPLRSLLEGRFPRLRDFRDTIPDPEGNIRFVVCAAQRIKSYIFETPGLNEIRGGSTLLDELTDEFAEEIGEELGPELVLRRAASTLEFLAPHPGRWTERYRQLIYGSLGAGMAAAASVEVGLRELTWNFSGSAQKAYSALMLDRFSSPPPLLETLPFEERCDLCRKRPAEGWYKLEGEFHPICRVCMTKLERGREERRQKLSDMLEWLGMGGEPEILGVKRGGAQEYTPRTLPEMIPKGTRRRLIGVIYGDGNNFGAILREISSISMALQWTHRVEKSAKAACAIAAARACQEGAMSVRPSWKPEAPPVLEKIPLQLLALGGDDISMICWGRLALRFCERFLSLTDMELSPGATFSLGALICDEKTPVQRAVSFAESALLRWAKRAWRANPKEGGTVAFLFADSPERVPSDLRSYLKRMFLKEGAGGRTCMTLRPLKGPELRFLLEKSRSLSPTHRGRLHRMMRAFVEYSPLVGVLHYIYQRGLSRREFFEALESPERSGSWRGVFGFKYLPVHKLPRNPLGEEDMGEAAFCPLWDLVEISKVFE